MLLSNIWPAGDPHNHSTRAFMWWYKFQCDCLAVWLATTVTGCVDFFEVRSVGVIEKPGWCGKHFFLYEARSIVKGSSSHCPAAHCLLLVIFVPYSTWYLTSFALCAKSKDYEISQYFQRSERSCLMCVASMLCAWLIVHSTGFTNLFCPCFSRILEKSGG